MAVVEEEIMVVVVVGVGMTVEMMMRIGIDGCNEGRIMRRRTKC